MTYLSHIATLVWQVLVFGILVGAGLPALFALGLRVLGTVPATAAAAGTGTRTGTTTGTSAGHADPLRVALAVACFVVGVAAAIAGIAFLVATGHR